MPDPEPCGNQRDGGEEVSCELVVAGGDTAEVFEFVEETFDEVALAIDRWIDGTLDLAVSLGGDVRSRPMFGEQFEDGAGVVAPIGDDVASRPEPLDQRRHGGLVGGLARREHEPDRQAASIDHGVDLGAQSPTRTADGVIRAPFLPPAACWWARTIEESMR